jgi:hypothetical protein
MFPVVASDEIADSIFSVGLGGTRDCLRHICLEVRKRFSPYHNPKSGRFLVMSRWNLLLPYSGSEKPFGREDEEKSGTEVPDCDVPEYISLHSYHHKISNLTPFLLI